MGSLLHACERLPCNVFMFVFFTFTQAVSEDDQAADADPPPRDRLPGRAHQGHHGPGQPDRTRQRVPQLHVHVAGVCQQLTRHSLGSEPNGIGSG